MSKNLEISSNSINSTKNFEKKESQLKKYYPLSDSVSTGTTINCADSKALSGS